MALYFLLAAPLALVWLAISNQITIVGFVVGYVLGLGVLALLRPARASLKWHRLPNQILALLVYAVILFWDTLLSGIDVARRVLSPRMDLKPGIIAIPTQDPDKNPLICALSAGAITLTPGELVVELEDNAIMFVHCLDVDKTAATAERAQTRRLKLLYRVLGR